MKLLITGGCGFLGSNLAAHAIEERYELLVVDNLSREGAPNNLEWLKSKGSFQFKHMDIRHSYDVNRVVQLFGPDAVFHLAGQVAMTTSLSNSRMDFEVNCLGTLNLLEAVRTYSPKSTMIYSSTNKVYGDLEQYCYRGKKTRYECIDKPNGFDESTPLNFTTPYGCSKGAADQYVLDYAHMFDLKTVVFRHSSMYGSRQFATYDQGWIGWFSKKAIETQKGLLKEPFVIAGNGKQVRDVLHATDIIRLFFSTLEQIENARGKAFNIGGSIENSLSLLELFALLEKMLDVRLHYKQLPPRPSDQKVFVADITKARRLLKWEPQISAQLGIIQLVEWLKNI